MRASDAALGMHRNITRRDFLNGVSVALAASVFNPARAIAFEGSRAGKIESDSYPPALTGMRGDHPGSFEVPHQMRDQRGWNLSGAINTGEANDLIVVGGGISGLSASHFFRQRVPNAKILILDNHDDGGHAKRNEFVYEGELW
jgi:spermidine dehydrogenase